MGTLTPFLPEDTVRQVGWVLVHFLWQGCAIAGLLWTVLKIAGKASSNSRYMIACTGLALMVLAPVVTFFVIAPDKPLTAVQAAEPAPAMAATDAAPVQIHVIGPSQEPASLAKPGLLDTVKARLETALPYCVIGWVVGVAALSVWYLGGWCQLQRLRRIGTKSVPDIITEKTAALAQQLGIRKAVYIVESALVQVPTVIGWLKPVILLPATAFTGLDEIQLRAMIAHELAHIRRCDYLVNIAQTVVEILGFYHPAVWWTSRQVRLERENCCDDIAIGLIQNRKQYAQALFSMEAIRAKQHTLAVAATGGAPLTNRIQRIAGKETNNPTSGWIPSVVTILLLAALLVTGALAMNNIPAEPPVENEMRVYPVNHSVSDFPETDDFSTPESAYAAINRVMAADDHEGWLRVSTERIAERLAREQKRKKDVDPEWAKVVLNARILEVRIIDDQAVVIAEFPQDLIDETVKAPIDCRHLALENGQWLNTGEDRYNSIDQARIKFNRIVKDRVNADKAADVPVDPDALLSMANTLFDKLANADYENILRYYNQETGIWRPDGIQDGWKKLDLNYMVHTNWPAFAAWVCQTFQDNPIQSIKLGEVYTSDKEIREGIKAPAVPYKLVLRDGGMLAGDLYFVYWENSDRWQAAEGLDWHLQEEPIKYDSNSDPRMESMNHLRQLGLAHFMFRDDNEGDVPDNLETLKPYLDDETYRWIADNAVLLDIKKDLTEAETAATPVAYDKTFLEKTGRRIVAFADGHVEIDNNDGLKGLLDKAQKEANRVQQAEKLKNLGLKLLVWAIEHDDVFPDNLQGVGFEDKELKIWALENVEYLAADVRADIDNPVKKLIAYDKTLLQTDDGTNVLFADGHVEFRKKDENGILVLYPEGREQPWEQVFYNLYQLDDSQILKRIAPPFIPERKDYYVVEHATQAKLVSEPPDYFTFHWDGALQNWGLGFMNGTNTLGNVLRQSLSIHADRFEGPDALLNLPVPGDWIVRKDTSDTARLHALESVLRDEFGRNVTFENRTVQRDVIVAKGTYRFSPPTGTYNDRHVHFYSDALDANEGSGGGTADTVAELIAVLGQRTGITVINETRNSSQAINQPYGHHRSSRLRSMDDEVQKHTLLDQMLHNLEKQTNLTFTVEERPIEKWFINEPGQTSNPAKMMGGFGGGVYWTDPQDCPVGDSRLGGGMGGFGGSAPLTDQITFPRNWDQISESRGGPTEAQIRRETEAQNQLLETKIDFSALTKDTTLEQAIDSLKKQTDPPLKISVLWNDLKENAAIDRTTPIGIEGIQSRVLAVGLKCILDALSQVGPQLDFAVDEGIITIATKDSLPTPYRTQVYDVADILSYPDTNCKPVEHLESLIDTMTHSIETESWFENGGEGRIDIFSDSKLIIRQTPEVHETLHKYFKNLRDDLFKYQVAIEARFILVDDQFLDDLGIDETKSVGHHIEGPANADEIRAALESTPLPELTFPLDTIQTLDDTLASTLIRATQQYPSARVLTAPKAIVLNGEAACMQVFTNESYLDIDDRQKSTRTGVVLDILPIIQKDNHDLLINACVCLSDILKTQTQTHNGKKYEIPYLQLTNIPIQAKAEDRETILVIGPELTRTETVNNTRIIDKQRLLILVKPTIIETEQQQAP